MKSGKYFIKRGNYIIVQEWYWYGGCTVVVVTQPLYFFGYYYYSCSGGGTGGGGGGGVALVPVHGQNIIIADTYTHNLFQLNGSSIIYKQQEKSH